MKSTEKMVAQIDELKSTAILIEGISEPVVLRYFETMNSGEYRETAMLFATAGELNPPFEDAVVGNQAIASYLETEAKAMKLYPQRGTIEKIEEEKLLKVNIYGNVETPWFGVNINWLFLLNEEQKITSATIRLVASPQELLNLRQFKNT